MMANSACLVTQAWEGRVNDVAFSIFTSMPLAVQIVQKHTNPKRRARERLGCLAGASG